MAEFIKADRVKVKTLGDVWVILERHGLKSDYCPHCDQFAQASVLQEQDEIISTMYEALRFFVERNASEYTYLDRGIGIATEVGKSFLNARQVLAEIESK